MKNVSTIIVPENLLKKIIAHAKKSVPNESVAILGGKIEGEIAYAKIVFTPENEDQSQVTFSVDPYTLLNIYSKIEEQGLDLIAIYHTHPAPPKPSETDRYYMEVNPYIWLISSMTKPEKPEGYFLLEAGVLKKVKIVIEK